MRRSRLRMRHWHQTLPCFSSSRSRRATPRWSCSTLGAAPLAASISSQNFGFCWSASSSCTFSPDLFVVQVATGDATLVVLNPWGRALSGFDQLPEFRILLERLVLLHLQSGAEEKVLEGMAAPRTAKNG